MGVRLPRKTLRSAQIRAVRVYLYAPDGFTNHINVDDMRLSPHPSSH